MEGMRSQRPRWWISLLLPLALAGLVGSRCITTPGEPSATLGIYSMKPASPGLGFFLPAKPIKQRPGAKLDSPFAQAMIEPTALGQGPLVVRTGNGFTVKTPTYHSTSPAIYRGLLLFGDGMGTHFYAIDARTGEQRWAVALQDDGAFPAACDDGVCAFTTESCSLYLVDAATGAPLWGQFLGDPLRSPPTIADGKVFATYPNPGSAIPKEADPPDLSEDGYRWNAVLTAFDARKGTLLWQHRVYDDALPLIAKQGEILSGSDGGLLGFDERTGELRSGREGEGVRVGVAVPADPAKKLSTREVFITSREVVAEDAKSHRILWNTRVHSPTEPILAGGSILVGTADGTVLRIDPADGTLTNLWRIGATVVAEPLVDSGWIYASTPTELVALNTGDPSITGWGQWGGDAQRSQALVRSIEARPFEAPARTPLPVAPAQTQLPTPAAKTAPVATPDEALARILAPDTPWPTPTADTSWEIPPKQEVPSE